MVNAEVTRKSSKLKISLEFFFTSERDVDVAQSDVGAELRVDQLPGEGAVGADHLRRRHVPPAL